MRIYHWYNGKVLDRKDGFLTEFEIKKYVGINETFAIKDGNVFIYPVTTYIP